LGGGYGKTTLLQIAVLLHLKKNVN